jgi:hypothetical protein
MPTSTSQSTTSNLRAIWYEPNRDKWVPRHQPRDSDHQPERHFRERRCYAVAPERWRVNADW